MVKVKHMPVVSVLDIEREIKAMGISNEYTHNIRKTMFDDQFMNDVYIAYYIDDDVCEECYADKEKAKVEQIIINILRKACPGNKSVLVDVTW